MGWRWMASNDMNEQLDSGRTVTVAVIGGMSILLVSEGAGLLLFVHKEQEQPTNGTNGKGAIALPLPIVA